MKKIFFILFIQLLLKSQGQGFSTSYINWSLPQGGKITGGKNVGFNNLNEINSNEAGTQNWSLIDMDGDKRPDLVVTCYIQGGVKKCFTLGSNQYWNVYLNTGIAFSTTPVVWLLPNGGFQNMGFIEIKMPYSSSLEGSQAWAVEDINGDFKPDLIVTAQTHSNNPACFSPGNNPYWKVYFNTGEGFSATSVNWYLPNGGALNYGINLGYNSIEGNIDQFEAGSQTWYFMDFDGDHKPELIVTSENSPGNFSSGPNPYWKVYSNTGSSFATSAINWSLPEVFPAMEGIGVWSNNGAKSWSVKDMDGDNRPDLIVTGEEINGIPLCYSVGNNPYWNIHKNVGTGFSTTPFNWPLPNGGKISYGINQGFSIVSGTALHSDYQGSQSWILNDLDGDNKPELVITAQLTPTDVVCFSPYHNPYWKMYENDNAGFITSPMIGDLPIGGKLSNGVNYGFNSLASVSTSTDDSGSQTWAVTDMDGDNIPDLVIAGQLQAGDVTSFSPTSSQYWKVYKSNFVTGIKENSFNVQTFNLFPNPNNGSFTIQSSIQEKLTVTNEVGQVVQTLELNQLNNFSSQISGLQNGVYFVAGKNSASKIVVIN